MDYLQSYFRQAGFLPSVALVLVFYALLLGVRTSKWGIALLAFPGTFAHELAHLVVGLLLRAKPQGFSVWPRAHDHGWTLGAVSFRNIGLLNGAWVTLAPLLLLPAAWFALILALLPLWAMGQWGGWLVAGYLTATALFAALPSMQDLRLGAGSILLYGAIGGGLCWAYVHYW